VAELEEIYNNYFKDVYLFVYGLSKDKHLAEDLTSETVGLSNICYTILDKILKNRIR
jgi:hypothetical protein